MPDQPRPVRVINVIARLNIGGTAMHVILLTAGLGPPAWHSTLVCGHIGPGEGDMTYLSDRYGVTPAFIKTLGRELHPLRDLQTLFELVRLFRRERPHIVHTHTAKAGFVGRVAARLAGVAVVVHTFHGHVFEGYFEPPKARLFLWLERLAARLSTRILTVSERVGRELAEVYHVCPPAKIVVMPLALDLSPLADLPRHQGEFRAAWGIPPQVPLLGLVGRMVPIKRHDVFLKAVAAARDTLPDLRAVLVGDGELRPAIEAQVDALGLGDCVTLTGWTQTLAPLYSDLDLLVISSDNEGTPVSAIEALAAGVPVVATSVGGVPNLLQEGVLGTLVPRSDPIALAEAMVVALRDRSDRTAARTETVAAFSMERLAGDMAALYRDLLEERTPREPIRR